MLSKDLKYILINHLIPLFIVMAAKFPNFPLAKIMKNVIFISSYSNEKVKCKIYNQSSICTFSS